MLEASGGSGPPKARVLWAPIVTGSVNRRAVSLRSLFAHEPRVVFRDNKRATSSSARTTTPRSFVRSISLSPPSFSSFFFPVSSSPTCDRALIRLVRLARYHLRYILRILLAALFSFLGPSAFVFHDWDEDDRRNNFRVGEYKGSNGIKNGRHELFNTLTVV